MAPAQGLISAESRQAAQESNGKMRLAALVKLVNMLSARKVQLRQTYRRGQGRLLEVVQVVQVVQVAFPPLPCQRSSISSELKEDFKAIKIPLDSATRVVTLIDPILEEHLGPLAIRYHQLDRTALHHCEMVNHRDTLLGTCKKQSVSATMTLLIRVSMHVRANQCPGLQLPIMATNQLMSQ